MAKLNDFPQLKAYLRKHMTEGLYLLQYRKCGDASCCQRKIQNLPPKVPAPVLNADGTRYLKFSETYGKIQTTEKDCPSLNAKAQITKSGPKYQLLARRVVATLSCHQCGKKRCVFSLDGKISTKGEREIEDVIFTCGMA